MADFKNSYKVDITTGSGYTVSADDDAVAGVGASAYTMIQNGQDVHIATATGMVIVPFHAIDHVIVTLTRNSYTRPADPTCA